MTFEFCDSNKLIKTQTKKMVCIKLKT